MTVSTETRQISDKMDWRNPRVSLMDKLNQHIDKKQKSGIVSNATKLNKFVPWFFWFVYLGSCAWMIFGTLPYQYKISQNGVWFFISEVFANYAFFQVLINWFLTSYTTSPYSPDVENILLDNIEVEDAKPATFSPQGNSVNHKSADNRKRKGLTGLTYNVMVVTNVTGKEITRESVPYWSWVQCFECKRPRPPRCHHCTLCKHCVLKRDHHCYFTRNCIGMNNQRYFIYFLIWGVVLTITICFQLIPFIFQEVLPEYSYWDLVAPFNVCRVITGVLPVSYCHLILVTWGSVFLTFISIGMCTNAIYLTLKGLTYFENNAGIKITDSRNLLERLRSVMGPNWAVGLFIPGGSTSLFVTSLLPKHLAPSKPTEDPVKWPFIKLE